MKDPEIVALFLERSEQAIGELSRQYGTAVRRAIQNILADPQDVEECEDDTYLRIWDSIPPQRPQYLGAYSCRIARNLALDRYRSRTAQKRNPGYDVSLDELASVLPASGGPEDALEARELAGAINRFLRQLEREDRYLFLRRYWFADPVAAIAHKTGKTPHAVSVRLFRIREKLKVYLKKEGMLP